MLTFFEEALDYSSINRLGSFGCLLGESGYVLGSAFYSGYYSSSTSLFSSADLFAKIALLRIGCSIKGGGVFLFCSVFCYSLYLNINGMFLCRISYSLCTKLIMSTTFLFSLSGNITFISFVHLIILVSSADSPFSLSAPYIKFDCTRAYNFAGSSRLSKNSCMSNFAAFRKNLLRRSLDQSGT